MTSPTTKTLIENTILAFGEAAHKAISTCSMLELSAPPASKPSVENENSDTKINSNPTENHEETEAQLKAHGLQYLGVYNSSTQIITLFSGPIERTAKLARFAKLGSNKDVVESITRVVLMHELAHLYTHKGKWKYSDQKPGKDYRDWACFAPANTEELTDGEKLDLKEIKEGLAQYWTQEAVTPKERETVLTLDQKVFEELAENAPDEYKVGFLCANGFLQEFARVSFSSVSQCIHFLFEEEKRAKPTGPRAVFQPGKGTVGSKQLADVTNKELGRRAVRPIPTRKPLEP